ncbi:hypothetical protein THIOSC15_1560001 [uncultured Thiomicrorhabdus sp.]
MLFGGTEKNMRSRKQICRSYVKINKFSIIWESVQNLGEKMSVNKMLKAYRTLFNYAKEKAIIAEYQTWQHLGHAIEKAEQADHDLAELTDKEFNQVQKDLHADMMQLAEYLTDVEQGVKEFLDMDLPVLEKLLIDKAMSFRSDRNNCFAYAYRSNERKPSNV